MDLDAEREKIRQEIQELERSLGPSGPSLEATEGSSSSPESDTEDEGTSPEKSFFGFHF